MDKEKQGGQYIKCCQCGKPITEDKVAFLMGNNGALCSDCLTKMYTDNRELILHRKEAMQMRTSKDGRHRRLRPSDIKRYLDQYIIGQDKAKQVLSNAVYNHYKMIELKQRQAKMPDKSKNVQLEKSNILLVGPSGCGKTAVIKALSRFLQVPFSISDATSLTAAG